MEVSVRREHKTYASESLEKKIQYLDDLFSQMPAHRRQKCMAVPLCMRILATETLNEQIYPEDPELSGEYIEKIPVAARWFDIGYAVGANWEKHMLMGMDLISNVSGDGIRDSYEDVFWCVAMDCALEHHENWDGSGEPYHLCGEEIHIMARICTLCHDFYDYHQKYMGEPDPYQKAVDAIRDGSGEKYDPVLVSAFERCSGELISAIYKVERKFCLAST